MRFVSRLLPLAALAAAAGALPVRAAEFVSDPKLNGEMAKKLNIPVHFALPASARATLQKNFNTKDRLIDFKHPDGAGAKGDVGLRIIATKRAGMSDRLGKSGIIQSGDLLLTFRPEWGGAGPYPNVQMGVSHVGIAWVQNGKLYNLDNPLSGEYNGRGDLSSEHYRTLGYMHVIRPRGLTEADRANIVAWSSRFNKSAGKIYPKEISFNTDYNAPKYERGKPPYFVQHAGRSALGQKPNGAVSMFCSEFAWSVLSLKGCDPGKTAEAFKGTSLPSCVRTPMTPMEATGDYMVTGGSSASAGLTDGPLMVIESMGLPEAKENELIRNVFVERPGGLDKLSPGHKAVATQFKPAFAELEKYYYGVAGGGIFARMKARIISKAFRSQVKENYSPTAFIVNTLLPSNNSNRTMDYVATVVIE